MSIKEKPEAESRHEVNKVVRVMSDKPLKFTIRLLMKSGELVELQSDEQPNAVYDSGVGEKVLRHDAGGNGYAIICRLDDLLVAQCEKNPV